MDFTIEKYRELLLALKEAGYELMRYDEYCEGKRAERMVVMRHDVDRSVERARRLAEVEKEMGVRTSYYFREKFVLNNGDDIKYIAGLGHEVGYHYEDLVRLWDMYEGSNLVNPGVIIDTNHSNSGKQYLEQIRITKEVLHSCRYNPDIRKMVKGFMIESYLVDGAQKVDGDVFGQSITDPCLGWEKTERLILDIADVL